jgi:hypothetical protein
MAEKPGEVGTANVRIYRVIIHSIKIHFHGE